ncbi:MAG TPA: hypothetical protein PK177_22110 [Burkholderiaceae bacterium]|nr:hypothetical protein [Burkholderiaceae bacterium]
MIGAKRSAFPSARASARAFPGFARLASGFAVALLAGGCAGPVDEAARSAAGGPAASSATTAHVGGPQPAATTQRLRGMYTHMVDTGSFVDCGSGQRLVVATEADNAALEGAYLEARAAPGIPVLAAVDGRVESRVFMEGPKRPMLIVERFVELRPGYDCSGPVAPVSLENTYRKLLSPGASPALVADRQAERT